MIRSIGRSDDATYPRTRSSPPTARRKLSEPDRSGLTNGAFWKPDAGRRMYGASVTPGTLITVEGLDGAGKTTLADGLVRELTARGTPVRLLREPGGVEVSERIRALVKDPALDVLPRTEALLYAAARAQLVEQLLRPLLGEGAVVLLDRFVDSSLAYQGAGRALGVEEVRAINLFATGGLAPARTLLLRISPADGRARQHERALEPDRLEREGEEFFAAIAAAYDDLARAEPQRIRVIDATKPAETVLRDSLAALDDLPLSDARRG